MRFSNPVKGQIHISPLSGLPNPWKRPAGNYDFALTQDFGPTTVAGELRIAWPGGEGIAAGTYPLFHIGIDLGNTRCGYSILAMAAGTVTAVGRDGLGALYVTLDHGLVDGHRYTTTYRHEATQKVAKGQKVTAGQEIATIGNTGTKDCHLHVEGYKDGHLIDLWRRLIQNTAVDPDLPVEDDMILTKYLPLYDAVVAKGYNVRSGPTTNDKVIRLTAAPEPWSLLGVAKGELANGSDQWYVRVAGLAFEYVHASAVSGVAKPVVDCTPAVLAAKQGQYDLDAKSIAITAATAKLANPRP